MSANPTIDVPATDLAPEGTVVPGEAAPPTHRIHVTRSGGPMGLDPKGQPKEASADTLLSLANQYGVPWKEIATATFGTTNATAIAEMLKDENFGVSVDGHWLMSPGLQVKVPLIGKDGKPFGEKKTGIPTWAKVLGLGAVGALGVWLLSGVFGGGGKKKLRGTRDDEDPEDDPDDEEDE